jgi:integrase
MRPSKTRKPFTLYQKQTKTGPVWYARFWDEETRRYAVTRSVGVPAEGKRRRRYEAEEAARVMLPSVRFDPAPDKNFVQYAAEFWTSNSPYARECEAVRKKPLSMQYVKNNHEDIRRHVEPFPGFRGVTLQSLNAGTIRDWMTWAAGKGMSGRRINTVLQSMRVAARYAVAREEIDRDPFKSIGEAEDQPREKGVLTPGEAAALTQAPMKDPRTRLAVLLGLLCGLRRGEVRGLLWSDIGEGLITIRHNWIDAEGMKAPKCKGGAVRENTRLVPAPAVVKTLLETLRGLARNPAPDGGVFEGVRRRNEPLGNNFFRRALTVELLAIGINKAEQRRRNIVFHSLRHTFVTLERLAGITDIEIQALAGHRSGKMMERYSHAGQVIDFESTRQKLQQVIGE